MQGLLHSISEAAAWDAQLSEGKALSDREEAVLHALDLMTRKETGIVTLRASALRETVARLLDESLERFGNPQWIGHILTQLHLLDEHRRKRDGLGISYFLNPDEVRDMMRRYEVQAADSES